MKKTINVEKYLNKLKREYQTIQYDIEGYRLEIRLCKSLEKIREIERYISNLKKIQLGLEKAYDSACLLAEVHSNITGYIYT